MNKLRIGQIIKELRVESDDEVVRKRYGLTPQSFRRLLRLLSLKKDVDHRELYQISDTYRSMVNSIATRRFPRVPVTSAIRVYDDGAAQRGFLRDVSENGIRVAGINATVGQIMKLRIPLNEVDRVKPIEFEAVCRWGKTKGKLKKYLVAGFEFVKIADPDKAQLKELMALFREKLTETKAATRLADFHLTEVAHAVRNEPSSRHFSGTLSGVDILDIVQLILLNGTRALLHVKSLGGNECELYLDRGEVLHAADAQLEGEEAFFSAMNFNEGHFYMKSWREPEKRTIFGSGEFLLMRAAHRRDERL